MNLALTQAFFLWYAIHGYDDKQADALKCWIL